MDAKGSTVVLAASARTKRKGGGPYAVPLTPSILSGVVQPRVINGVMHTARASDIIRATDRFCVVDTNMSALTGALDVNPHKLSEEALAEAIAMAPKRDARLMQVLFPRMSGLVAMHGDGEDHVHAAVQAILASAKFTHKNHGALAFLPDLKAGNKLSVEEYTALWLQFVPVFYGVTYDRGGRKSKSAGLIAHNSPFNSVVSHDFFESRSPVTDEDAKVLLTTTLIRAIDGDSDGDWRGRDSCALVAWCVEAVFAYIGKTAVRRAFKAASSDTRSANDAVSPATGDKNLAAFAFLGEVAYKVYGHVHDGSIDAGIAKAQCARFQDFIAEVDASGATACRLPVGSIARLPGAAK